MRRAWMTAVAAVLASSPARASSVSSWPVSFAEAAVRSARIVTGSVVGPVKVEVEGETFTGTELAVESALKGPAAQAGEHLRVFDPEMWQHHQMRKSPLYAAASYGVEVYEKPAPGLRRGARLLVFLAGERPPTGLGDNAVFLVCRGAIERPARAKELARVRSAAFDVPLVMKPGDIAVLPETVQIEVTGVVDKSPDGAPGPAVAITEGYGHRSRRLLLAAGRPPVTTSPPRMNEIAASVWAEERIELLAIERGKDGVVVTLRVHSDRQAERKRRSDEMRKRHPPRP